MIVVTWWHVVAAFVGGALLGSSVATWGAWLAFRDNARGYFGRLGYGPEQATREADRVMGVEWYDPRDIDNQDP